MFDPIPDEDRVCGTCAHWNTRAATHMGLPIGKNLAPCAVNAINVDAGDERGVIVLLGKDNHCRAHEERWTPSADYRKEHPEALAANDGLFVPPGMHPVVQILRVA